MTELSKGAQYIFDAVWNEPTFDPGGWESSCRIEIAAALRAAATLNPGPFVPEQFGEGWKAAMNELAAIADELDPPLDDLYDEHEQAASEGG